MFQPIGSVQNSAHQKVDFGWGDVTSQIVLREDLREGLRGLRRFSHALILCHLNEAVFDPARHLLCRSRERSDMPLTGVFARRAKDRPNPIGVTAVKILEVEIGRGVLTVQGLDAIDGTPVLDIKPYFPAFDCRAGASVPPYVDELMRDYF